MITVTIPHAQARLAWRRLLSSILLGCACLLFNSGAWAAPATQDNAPLDAIAAQIGDLRATPPTTTERFRQPAESWEINGDEEYELYYHVGAYHVHITSTDLMAWGNGTLEGSDFYLEVDTFHAGGPLNNQFGIVFRQVDLDNYYLFTISSDGYYKLEKQVDNAWVSLIDWAASDAIATGEGSVNQLGVLAQGEQIGLLINDTVVDVVTDDAFSAGLIGLAAGSYDEADVTIAFDDLAFWELAAPPVAEATPRIRLGPRTTPTPTAAAATSTLLAEYKADAALTTEEFSSNDGTWVTSTGEAGSQQIDNDRFAITINKGNTMLWSTYRRSGDLAGNFLAELDVELVDGPATTDMGLLTHVVDDQHFILYAIRADGTYGLWRRTDDGWSALIDWSPSDLIDTTTGAVNRLGIYRNDEQVTLFINDTEVDQATIAADEHGWFALAASANNEEAVTVAFDNFALWTDEALPEPTPMAELPDVSERLTEIRKGEPDFSEGFRRDEGNWTISEDADAAISYQDRTLHMRIDSENWLSWSAHQTITAAQLDAFYVEVDIEQVAGPSNGEYGVIFRWLDDNNFYGYYLSGQGTFSLWRKSAGEWTELMPWTVTTALIVGDGAVNRLGLLVEGAQMTLFVNDVVVGQVTDDTLSGGQLALSAGTFAEGSLEVTFDNFDFWALTAKQTETSRLRQLLKPTR